MGKFIDLTGQKFGRLEVVGIDHKRGNCYYWKCICDCGNTKVIEGTCIRFGRTKSCGCLKQESDRRPKGNVDDLIGRKFGALTVVSRHGSDKRGEALWGCICDCGNPNEVIVLGSNLRSGHTQSCGCVRMSHGEIKIAQLLYENGISFEYDIPLFKLKSGLSARFDFYVSNKYLIEYDGETHYAIALHGWHNDANVSKIRENDAEKTDWCRKSNIPLIRIPFTHYDSITIKDLLLTSDNKFVTVNCEGLQYSIDDLSSININKIHWNPIAPKKPIIEQYDIYGNFIREFNGYDDLENSLNIPRHSVYKNLSGHSTRACQWQFKIKGSSKTIGDVSHPRERPILQKDKDGSIVCEYNNMDEASLKFNDINKKSFIHSVTKACNKKLHTYLGYIWDYNL